MKAGARRISAVVHDGQHGVIGIIRSRGGVGGDGGRGDAGAGPGPGGAVETGGDGGLNECDLCSFVTGVGRFEDKGVVGEIRRSDEMITRCRLR